jgi:hypothetical protein
MVNNRGSREGEEDAKYIFTSTVVISAREKEDFGVLLQDQDWTEIVPPPGQRIWTDDYSNVIGAVIRQYRHSSGSDDDEPAEEPVPQPAPPAAAPPAPAPEPPKQ